MSEYACAIEGMPALMRDRLWGRVSGRKNRIKIMDFADWSVREGHVFRSKKGFDLVRGSDPDSADGLKERRDLQGLGFTSDIIRGAIKALVEVGFYDKEAGKGGASLNFRGQKRRPPSIYRVAQEFRELYREAVVELRNFSKTLPVAASAVAKKLLSGINSTLVARKPLTTSPPNCPIQDRASITGEIGTSTPLRAQEGPFQAQAVASTTAADQCPVSASAPAREPPREPSGAGLEGALARLFKALE